MGLLDEFSESPEQEKDSRATKEGLREAREGGTFSNILNDFSDELTHGRDYLDRKVATREGENERIRGNSSLDNLVNDIHDEFAHGPEFVARKQYYRERPGESPSAEEGPNYGSGGENSQPDYHDLSSENDWVAQPPIVLKPNPLSLEEKITLACVGVVIVVILALLIGFANLIKKAAEPATPVSPLQAQRLKLGIVQTCSTVRAWRDYTPKSDFRPGEELLLYTETLDVNHNGRIDLLFSNKIVATNGSVIANATLPVAESATTSPSWATWQGLWIPSDTPTGSYVATVSIRDNITGLVGTQSMPFSVGAVGAQISSELQMGVLTTCSAVRGWQDYTAQTSFMAGDEVFLYAEALGVNHGGRIDLSFDDSIFTPTGTKLLGTAVPVSTAATGPSWAAWPGFEIPSDAPPGSYTATVAVRDNLTGNTGSKSVVFTVSALNRSPTEEAAGTVAEPADATTNHEDAKPEAEMPPSPAGQRQDCYDGVWRENEANLFVWNFRRYGNTLRISRNDRFVKGEFQRTPAGWVGFLSWGNGTIWKGVVLHQANDACNEIATNQRWWYRR